MNDVNDEVLDTPNHNMHVSKLQAVVTNNIALKCVHIAIFQVFTTLLPEGIRRPLENTC